MTIENSLVKRQIFALRHASYLAGQYSDYVAGLLERISIRIARNPDGRLDGIAQDLQRILDTGFKEMSEDLNQDILDFAIDESEIDTEIFNANSKVPLRIPNAPAVERALTMSALSVPVGPSDLTMQEALTKYAAAQSKNVTQTIADGVLLGESNIDIAKRVQALSDKKPKAQTEALVRTFVAHAQAQAQKATVNENKSLFQGEEWISVLDSRTTLICAGRDGNIYPVGKGPYPPAHWNCRSRRIPALKSEFESASQPKQTQDFDSWLRKQNAGFQDEYFSQFPNSKEKAKLFRQGNLPIQDFRDETGKNYTLEQLRALNPLAFDKANIEMPSGR
jgi:SPP1 gp7 family putative phage head morphogenesis protein